MSTPLYSTGTELLASLGSALARRRIARGLSQVEAAGRANVATTSLQRLESGRGGSVATLVKVVRALDASGWIESLAPAVSISPLDAVRGQVGERRRVFKPRQRRDPRRQG